MIDLILWVIWFVTCLPGLIWYELYILHMFQQNSYKPREYGEWMALSSNVGRLLGRSLYGFISLPFIALGGRGCLIGACLLNLLTAFVNKPHKAKKPLVYTARVKRMIITSVLIVLLGCVLLCLVSREFPKAAALWLLCLFVLCPFVVILVNVINHPMEAGINRHYVNDAARILKEMSGLIIVGVTGSYGKTSVKYFLNKLLSVQYSVLQTPGNYNTTLGVVRTIREQMKSYHEVFICEMGARQVGDIKEICDLVHPDYGVITSIGPQHLQSFHTLENVISTKFELMDAVPEQGKIFLNYDNEWIRKKPVNKQVISYGTVSEDVDFRAYDISVSKEGSAFKMKDEEGREYEFHTKLVGTHNVQNIAGALAVAHTLGIPMEKLTYPVRQLESVPHRLQLLKQGSRTILDDSYNSNKNGFKAALDTLSMFEDLRILMTPGMVELGEQQYEENKEVGIYAYDKCDYAVLVGKEQTKPIQEGLLESGFPQNRMIVVDHLEEGFEMINAIPNEKPKVILIENDLPDQYTG